MNLKTHDYITGAEALPTDEILTPTETAIAAGFASGLTGKEVADVNNISQKTVIKHTQNIYDKAGITRSTSSLVSWFLQKNFHLDMTEINRRAGALFLLALVGFQIYVTDFDDSFVRARSSKVSVRQAKSGRRSREDENNTFTL